MIAVRAAATFILLALISTPAVAQQTTPDTAKDTSGPPVFLVGGGWSRLTQATVEGGVIFPIGKEVLRGPDAAGWHGVETAGSGGNGGFQVASGYGEVLREDTPILTWGWELLGTVGKLGRQGGVVPNSSYVGVNAGVIITFIHVTLGLDCRVSGDSNQPRWFLAPIVSIVVPFSRRW